MVKSERYDSLDSMRLVAALLVAIIHVGLPVPHIMINILVDIGRISVPFFFCLSGFFLYSDDIKTIKKRVIKAFKKTSSLLISSTIIYAMLEFILWERNYSIKEVVFSFFSIDFFFFNQVPFMPVGWYLFSYMYVLVIVYFICKYFPSPNFIWYTIIAVCLIFWMLTGSYQNFIFNELFTLKYNLCWIVALPWVLVGMLFSYFLKRNTDLLAVSNKVLSFLCVFFLLLSVGEHFFIKKITGLGVVGTGNISTIISVILIFYFLLTNKSKYSNLAKFGRKYSLSIYLYHIFFYYIFSYIFGENFDFPFQGFYSLPFNHRIVINAVTMSVLAAIIPTLVQNFRKEIYAKLLRLK